LNELSADTTGPAGSSAETPGPPSGNPLLASGGHGPFGRAVGVIFSPTATFKEVAVAPNPAGILLLVCVVIALATGLPAFTARGQQTMLDAQVQRTEQITGRSVPPEAYARMQAFVRYSGYLAVGGAFVFVPFVTMIFAAVFWAFFNAVLGGTAGFKHVLGVAAHAQVIGALGAAAAAPIQYVQGVQTTAGPFNLGALVPTLSSSSFLARYLSGISFFTLWELVVTAIGLAVLYRRRTLPIATGLLVVYLGIAGAVTTALSAIAGR
jgi:Yip1 domain